MFHQAVDGLPELLSPAGNVLMKVRWSGVGWVEFTLESEGCTPGSGEGESTRPSEGIQLAIGHVVYSYSLRIHMQPMMTKHKSKCDNELQMHTRSIPSNTHGHISENRCLYIYIPEVYR